MDGELPWNVPPTTVGRDELLRLADVYRASGATRELGETLSRLAHVVKHVGIEGSNAFSASAKIGAEAVRLLREAGDRRALARALRIAAVPMVQGIDHRALLEESLAIAREIGDREEEGWTLFRMTGADGVAGATVGHALECFDACGCIEGKACCLVRQGIADKPARIELLEEAALLFERAGNVEEARRTRQMAEVFRRP